MMKKIARLIRRTLLLFVVLSASAGAAQNISAEIFKGNLEPVKKYVEIDKKPINATLDKGNTLIHLAAQCNKIDIVNYLIAQGANVLIKNSDGKTPYDLAPSSNEGVQEALSDAKTKFCDSIKLLNWTSFYWYVYQRDSAYLTTYLEGRDLGCMYYLDTAGCTPLHLAAKCGDFELFKLLVDAGVSTADWNRTPTGPTVMDLANDQMKKYVELNPFLLYKSEIMWLLGKQKISDDDLYTKIPDIFKKAGPLADQVKGFALTYAASKKNLPLEVFKGLVTNIKMKCPVDSVDEKGMTALHWAAVNQNTDLIKLLVNNAVRNANIELKNKEGKTALDLANQYNKELLLDTLKKQYTDKIKKILLDAQDGKTELSDLWKKAVKDIQDVFWRIAFHKAAGMVGEKVVSLKSFENFIKDLDIADENGETAMHHAARAGNKNAIIYLVNHRAKIEVENKGYFTPLHVAIKANQKAIVKYLLKKGAELRDLCVIDRKTYTLGLTENAKIKKMLLKSFVKKYDEKVMDILRLETIGAEIAIAYGQIKKDIDDENIGAAVLRASFDKAIIYGRPWFAWALIDGKKLTCKTKARNGQTLLHSLIVAGNLEKEEAMDWLFDSSVPERKNGDSVNIKDNDGMTPLHLAILRGNLKFVEALIKHGADLAIVAAKNRNIFHFAAWSGNAEIVLLLMDKFKSMPEVIKDLVNSKDGEGWTPMEIAKKRDKENILKMWVEKEYGAQPGDMSLYGLKNFEEQYFAVETVPGKVVESEKEIEEKPEIVEENKQENEENSENQPETQFEEQEESGVESEKREDSDTEEENNETEKIAPENGETGGEQKEIVPENLVEEKKKIMPSFWANIWTNLPGIVNKLSLGGFGFFATQAYNASHQHEPYYLKKRIFPVLGTLVTSIVTHFLERKTKPAPTFDKKYLLTRGGCVALGALGAKITGW